MDDCTDMCVQITNRLRDPRMLKSRGADSLPTVLEEMQRVQDMVSKACDSEQTCHECWKHLTTVLRLIQSAWHGMACIR